ncbi:MAG: hypothetical protein AAB263_08295 [Planctomycetota bacterium]
MDSARRPSVSSLAGALTRHDETVAIAGKQRIAIARPSPMTLALLTIALALLVTLGWFLMILSRDMTELVAAVRDERATYTQRAQEGVPTGTILLDAEQWRRELSRRPLAAGNIHRIRCQLLAGERRWDDILTTVQWVRLNNPADLRGETQIMEAEALMHLQRISEANQVLHGIDVVQLDSVWRARASELAGRLWLEVVQSAKPPRPTPVAQPESTQGVEPSPASPAHD